MFLEKNAEKIFAIMNKTDRISNNFYIWITNLKERETWCSEKTKEFFGLSRQIFSDFEYLMKDYVHPDHRQEYLAGMEKRLQGQELEHELCVRMRENNGSYVMFSIHAEELRDEEGALDYLIIGIKNENAFSEIDALTDLYSETRYVEDLEKLIAAGEKFAVLQIHVEGFSTFNLIYGRDFSNELLRAIALKFIYMMDMDKAVYRLERERFVFILKKPGGKSCWHLNRRCAVP